MSEIYMTRIDRNQKDVLWNLLQKYLYEMTLYYEDTMDRDGNYPYRYFDAYFENEPGREAFFFIKDREVIGFAMINTHSFDDSKIDHCLAEFTIFPAYRGNHNAESALQLLLKERSGRWQLKYSTKNVRGMKFWKKVLLPYHPAEKALDDSERLVNFFVEVQIPVY